MLRNISLKIPYKGCPGQEVRINGLFHPLIKVRRGDITHLDPNLLPKLPVRDIQVARISPFQQAEIVARQTVVPHRQLGEWILMWKNTFFLFDGSSPIQF